MKSAKTSFNNSVCTLIIAALVSTLCPINLHAQAVDTSFTYQGQLKEDGVPADGEYDLLFKLFDAAGTQVGTQIGRENTLVTNGLFTVILDFGTTAFDGDARFLEIGVRPGDSGAFFTTLSPRQEITATPYAATALKTVGVDGHSLDSANGSVEDAVYVATSGKVFMSYGGLNVYDGAGHGITFTTDTFTIDSYPSEDNVYRYESAAQRHRFYTDGISRMEIGSTGNIGIGVSAPATKLEVDGMVKMTGFQMGTSSTSGYVLTADATGKGKWMALPTTIPSPWQKDVYDNIFYGNGNVGIGMGSGITPAYPLHVEGTSQLNGNVGINTTPTTNALTVNGTASINGSASVTGTVEADEFTYDTPKNRVLNVLGMNFQPRNSQIEYSTGWAIAADSTETSASFIAPVQLPNGAVVTGLSAVFSDHSASQDLSVALTRYVLSSGGISTLASVETEGTPGHRTTVSTTGLNIYINNNYNAYYLNLYSDDWETGMQLYSVRITYTIDQAD